MQVLSERVTELFVLKSDANASQPAHHSTVVLLHGQAFSSAVWRKINTYETLANAGYDSIGIDLPGHGRTIPSDIPDHVKPSFLSWLLEKLALDKVVLVCPSWSARYGGSL